MLKENDIQRILKRRFDAADYHLCNSFVFSRNWESDYFCLGKSGYCTEVEIKCTKKDFRDDFKKEKHQIFSSLDQGYYIQNKGQTRGDKLGEEIVDEVRIAYGIPLTRTANRGIFAPASRIAVHYHEKLILPNRFYFASEPGIIPLNKIPDYAGLIYTVYGTAEIIKTAPLLHKRKQDLSKILLNKFYYKYISLENQIQK